MDRYKNILIFLFLASVFLLSLNKISDPDAWIHLSMGRLIWNLRGFPSTEPFVYTMTGEPFSYSSWLFGLTYYMAYHFFNVYGVILLKAITITAAFYILLKDSLKPYKNHLVVIIIISLVTITARQRFVERPDTFLMIFLPFSIFSLNAYLYEDKKYIYFLPFVHMLWANSHSSINLMLVPFLSFIAGGLLQQFFEKKGARFSNTPSSSQVKTIFFIFILSVASSLISPYFISQYNFGAQFLTSDVYKSRIMELRPPTWQTDKLPFLLAGIVCMTFMYGWRWLFLQKKAPDKFKSALSPSLIDLLIVIPFIYLSFAATRFIFLFAIISGPVLARNISYFFEWAKGEGVSAKIAINVIMLWLVSYTSSILLGIGPFCDRSKEFGFGVNYKMLPENALRYMDKNGVKGKVFNIFQWGQYIVWRDFPERTPFVDGRGYIAADLLEKMDHARYKPAIMDDWYTKYGFESVLIDYPNANANLLSSAGVNDFAFSNPEWALVYWDDNSLVYLKRGGIYDAVIKRDEYRFVKPANSISRSDMSDWNYLSNLKSEIKRNIEETGSSRATALLGLMEAEAHFQNGLKAYLEGRYDIAAKEFKESIENDPSNAVVYSNLGYVNFDLGELNDALLYQKKAIEIDPDYANAHYGLALIYKRQGVPRMAKKHWEEYLRIEPSGEFSERAKKEIDEMKRM